MIENSTLNLTKLETKKTISPEIIEKEEMDADFNEQIDRVRLLLEGKKEISLVLKIVNNLSRNEQEKEMSPSDVWIFKWHLLKEAGIPTLNTVRKVNDQQVAMTDLSVNGSSVYGKADMIDNRKIRDTDKYISDIDVGKLRNQAQRIADLADEADIVLANDDALALIVSATGQWKLIALDFGLMMTKEDFLKIFHPSFLKNWNQLAVGDIVRYILALQENFKKNIS